MAYLCLALIGLCLTGLAYGTGAVLLSGMTVTAMALAFLHQLHKEWTR